VADFFALASSSPVTPEEELEAVQVPERQEAWKAPSSSAAAQGQAEKAAEGISVLVAYEHDGQEPAFQS
jgi:hypothetical protein